MTDELFVLTTHELQHITFINRNIESIRFSLINLPESIQSRLKDQINTFINEADKFSDAIQMLRSQ